MSRPSAEALAPIKRALRELGYTPELIREDYAFADFTTSAPRVRRIALAAFGHTPTSYESAWIGVTIGSEDAQSLRRFHALGAPQLLVFDGDSVNRWKMPASGEPEFQDRFPAQSLLGVMRERRKEWGQEVVARAKAIAFATEPLQLDFYDAGLVPAIEATIRKKLDKLLDQALARAFKAYEEHVGGEADLPGVYRLVFRLLAAKLLADRGHGAHWVEGDAGEVVSRVEQYYYGSRPIPPAVSHPDVQRTAWRPMRTGFHLQNVSVRTLAYIYENTLVNRDTRKQQSIHGTPPEVAEYVVRRLPLERLDRSERRVFEPFAGHAVFLIAALGRLRELLEPGISHEERHDYFVRMLAAMEEEPFAIEVARLSLMLADYPNPNGWRLEQRDVFAADDLDEHLKWAQVVLCNPPFEDFTAPDRARYERLRSVSQPAEILARVLTHPPAQLGFVLPRVFRDGQAFRELRTRLVRTYGAIEVTELPERTFAHSDVETVLLLAHGRNQGEVELRCASVRRQDFPKFLRTGEPTRSATSRISTIEAERMPALWRFPLERVWDALREHPRLESVADVHRGIEYKLPLRSHWDDLVSDEPKSGFQLALINVADDYEPYHAAARHYLNASRGLMRRGADLGDVWGKPKVVANFHRTSRGPWPLIAAQDRQGLMLFQNFHGVWPTSDWPIEVIASVLNGHVANAFVDLREEKRHIRVRTIEAVPLPRFSDEDLTSIADLVREYERLRAAVDRDQSAETLRRCQAVLAAIDTRVLRGYGLRREVEDELMRHFASAVRPGPRTYARVSDHQPSGGVQLPLGLEAATGQWVVINERLLDEARAALGTTSVEDTVEAGLRAAIAQRRGHELLARFDGIEFDMTDEDLHRMRRLDLERLERLEQEAAPEDETIVGSED